VATIIGVLPAAAASADDGLPDTEDPRATLAPGWFDAEEYASNAELLAHRDRPEGFVNPANPGDFAVAQSDLALTDTHAFVGSFNGFNIYDISDPADPTLVNATVCPGGQGDPSIYGDLLFISVEQASGRVDCGRDATVGERFQGVRIFDVSDVRNPVQVAAVQTCRGSHTHTLVDDPNGESVFVYVSGTAGVRNDPTGLAMGCATTPIASQPLPNDARWRIDIIEVPLDRPQDAEVVGGPRLFADADGNYNGLQNSPPTPQHPSGANWGPTPVTQACHDITAYPAIGLAAGACSGNGILIDITDPADPVRVAEAADPNFAYWHSATFSNDGSKVVFTDEWGGGTGARCRATDRLEWGANAIFDIVDGADGPELQFASYYKLPVAQTSTENCVAHNGSLVPVPGRDVMVQAWYQGGMSVFDFTDSAAPVEIASFDRGPISDTALRLGGFWSTYWHNGHVIGAEIARGLDVLKLTASEHLSADELAAAELVRFGEFNAQLQPEIVHAPSFRLVGAYLDQLVRAGGIDADVEVEVRGALERAERFIDGKQRRAGFEQLDAALRHLRGTEASTLVTAIEELRTSLR
jgi:hypothetical protein